MSVTSISCSGTCLILSMPRQPNVRHWATMPGPRRPLARDERGVDLRELRRALGASSRWRSCGDLLGLARPRRGGPSGPGTPRPGSAGRARSRPRRCRRRRARRSPPRPARRPRPAARAAAGSGSRCASSPSSSAARGRWSGSSRRTCSAPRPTDAFSCAGVPSAITRPWSITAIRSASWSASSRYWVHSSTVVPWPTSARTMSQTWLRERGSRPVVGSSRNISRGVTTMLAAMSRRRRMPPE